MSIPAWAANTLYQPGTFIVPRSAGEVTQHQPNNADFEDGMTDWTQTAEFGAGTVVASTAEHFSGSQSALFAGAAGTGPNSSVYVTLANNYVAPVRPGQKINFSCMVFVGVGVNWNNAGCFIQWYDSSNNPLSQSAAVGTGGSIPGGMIGGAPLNVWRKSAGSGTAPAHAAFAQFCVTMTGNGNGGTTVYVDDCMWDYTFTGLPPGLVFEAIQTAAGLSGAHEPVWPIDSGDTVVDNAVTWQAQFASLVQWTAYPILESGPTEPTWPLAVGGHVKDGFDSASLISWVATDGRVTDVNCPNSREVCIGASKIFACNNDTIAYSATTNPLDWTSQFDAGYLPFGLQTYGNEPVKALGLYRSNLMAFNALGYQMWQIDPDPNNMALLDATPVGCQYHRSVQPCNNDLLFLSPVGIRSIGVAGAGSNLQAGSFGKAVDPIVRKLIAGGETPIGLVWPGTGQYWLNFGSEAVVFTANGGSADMSWSRYEFPETPGPIDDWTVLDGVLYLRSYNKVWQVDQSYIDDDTGDTEGTTTDDTVTYTGTIELTEGSGTVTITGIDTNEGWIIAPNDTITSAHITGIVQPYGSGSTTGIGSTGTYQLNAPATASVTESFSGTAQFTDYQMLIRWNYLDFGPVGLEKQLEGFDLVCTGSLVVYVGYDQNNTALVTDDYALDGDTLPGIGLIPLPLTAPSFQFNLSFNPNQYAEWQSLLVHINTLSET
jgi:hypothetical protein